MMTRKATDDDYLAALEVAVNLVRLHPEQYPKTRERLTIYARDAASGSWKPVRKVGMGPPTKQID